MKVAIATDGNDVSGHFGRCPSFTMVELDGSKVVEKRVIPNPGHQTGFLPRYFRDEGVNMIVAGGMGRRAEDLFAEFNVTPVLGVTGSVDAVIQRLADGSLQGAQSLCVPKSGAGYGIPKLDGHGE